MSKSCTSKDLVEDSEDRADPDESTAADAPNPSTLIDPNLDETEEAFGRASPADDSVDSAVAALHQDRLDSAAADTPRASAPVARRKNDDSVPGLEPDGDKFGLEHSVASAGDPSETDTPSEDRSSANSQKASSQKASSQKASSQKVSELTMLGVDEMLRRSERGGDRRWRLGWVLAGLVVLAGLGGLGYLLYHEAGSVSQAPEAAEKIAKEWVIHPASDSVAPEDRFSIRGLQLAIETADWRPVGDQGSVETTTTRTVMQTYRHKDRRVDAAFHDLSDRAEARKLVDRTELPARAVRCDTKVVVLEPATDADDEYAEGLVMLLENYREAVIGGGGSR